MHHSRFLSTFMFLGGGDSMGFVTMLGHGAHSTTQHDCLALHGQADNRTSGQAVQSTSVVVATH